MRGQYSSHVIPLDQSEGSSGTSGERALIRFKCQKLCPAILKLINSGIFIQQEHRAGQHTLVTTLHLLCHVQHFRTLKHTLMTMFETIFFVRAHLYDITFRIPPQKLLKCILLS